LATIAFKPVKGNTLGKIRLMLIEANSPAGAPLLADAKVAGYPSSDRTQGVVAAPVKGSAGSRMGVGAPLAMPHIDSIRPSSGKVDPESVLEVTLYGRGFADGNTVLFDAATVERSVSEAGGTILKFIVPTMIPARGRSPLRRVEAGKFAVQVLTRAGMSNAVSFTARGEER
jgi:hypothetical protein